MTIDVPVIVVGAGPVGMTLAMDLASRGIETLVLERRPPRQAPDARCNHVSARSMEVFRRLGFAAKVRAAGLPADHAHDVVYATRFNGYELGRVRIPAARDRFDDAGYADGSWPTPEPPHRINQIYLEPQMWAHAESFERLTVRWNADVQSICEHPDHVDVTVVDRTSGATSVLRTRYLLGCDGTRSTVRRELGVRLVGDDGIMMSIMATITAPELAATQRLDRAWMYWILNAEMSGNVIALDGKERWIVNVFVPNGTDVDALDFAAAARRLLATDVPFTVEDKNAWTGRRLLAERFGSRRVFIAGDAAHSWLPMAGYAMNAGIADAANLAWKVAAVLDGWGGPELLASYESERRPVLEQVSTLAMNVRRGNSVPVPAEIEEPDASGAAARERFGRYILETDSAQFACIGLNFGYYYEASPIIAYDGAVAPAYSLGEYTPSTVPGCRMPHAFVDGTTSLYDLLGPGYTLVRFDPSVEVAALQRAAERTGVPLTVLDLDPARLDTAYDVALVLVRPDQHVAWRGPAIGGAAEALFERLRGGLTAQAA
jgi:2-polyprenyl-6-methoxyphenol hydroxylase-like FAD-dependent oxidoreductase